MESILETKKISREEFFKLSEDDLMFITNPGRMGDEDGTTFIVKKDNNYICYRIDGWYMGNIHNNKDYITYDDVLNQFPKWRECLKNVDINDLEKDISDKYRYVYMGFGNGLCVDKSIYYAFYPYLVDERKEKLLKIPKKDRKDYPECMLNFDSWKPAFIRTIKGEPKFYMHLDYTKILIIYESGKVQLNKINSGKITKKDYNDYKKIIKDVSFVIVVGTPKLEKELFENKYVMCINNTLKIGTKNCNIKTDSEKEVDEIIKNVMETLFYTSILTYTLEDLSDDLIGKFLYKSYKVEDLENINKIICDIPQNGRSKIYISIDIPSNMDLYTLEDIINKFQENFLYSHFAFSCPMVERKEPKIHIFYEIKKDVENINYKLVGHKVKVYLKDGQEIIGSFDDDFEEEKEILVGLVCIKYNEIEKMEPLEDISNNFDEKMIKYVSVVYDDDFIANVINEPSFYYKTDIENINIGDMVLVDRVGKEVLAKVVDIEEFEEDDVPYPIEKTKNIIKIIEKNDNPICPICGEVLAEIIYGLCGESNEVLKRENKYSGGCCMFEDSPKYHCYTCDKDFYNNLEQYNEDNNTIFNKRSGTLNKMLDLELEDYEKSEISIYKGKSYTKDDIDCRWYDVSLNIKNKYFCYNEIRECLLESELWEIYNTLNKCLNNKLTERKKLWFIEHDIEMEFSKSADEDHIHLLEFQIYINLENIVGSDYYSFLLDDKQMIKLRDYIGEVLGANKEKNK